MASTSFSSKIEYCAFLSVRLNEHSYQNVKFSVLKELCVDILLGQYLMKSNSGADGLFGDNCDKLQICYAAPTQVQPYRYFV